MSLRSPARAGGRLLAAHTVGSVGDGLFLALSAIYLLRVLGWPVDRVGLLIGAAWGCGFLAALPIGRLGDRLGPSRSAALASAGVAAGLLGLLTAPLWPPVVTAALLAYTVCQSALTGLKQALVARAVRTPEERVRLRARLQARGNAGLAAGAALGAGTLTLGPGWFGWALGLDAAAFVASSTLLLTLGVGREPVPVEASRPHRPATVLRDRRFLGLAAVNAAFALYMPMLSVGVPLWVVARTAAPNWAGAAVLIANTLVVMACQVAVSRRVRSGRAAARGAVLGGCALAASALVFGLAGLAGTGMALALLAAATVLQVAGEMAVGAGIWWLAFDLTPDGRDAEYQSVLAAGIPAARCLGPALFGVVVAAGLPGWSAVALVFLAAAAALGGWALRHRVRTARPPVSSTESAGPAPGSPTPGRPSPVRAR